MSAEQFAQFKHKISQLNAFVGAIEADPALHASAVACSNHHEIVALATERGFDIAKRWGEASKAVAPANKNTSTAAYWRANLKLVAALLFVWAFVSYGLSIVWVEPLNAWHLGGFPLGFWFAQQGAILVFIVLILVYCLTMDRLDRQYRSTTAPPTPEQGTAEQG